MSANISSLIQTIMFILDIYPYILFYPGIPELDIIIRKYTYKVLYSNVFSMILLLGLAHYTLGLTIIPCTLVRTDLVWFGRLATE